MNLKDRARGKYFKISGFEQFEKDDIWLRTKKIKQALKQKKERKRVEKHFLNFNNPKISEWQKDSRNARKDLSNKKTKGQKLSEQIANGFKVAKKWREENEQI